MEPVFALLVAAYLSLAVYLMLSPHIVRILIGVVVLGTGVNLLIFTAGRLTRLVPPVIPVDADTPALLTANPLPQALILTAIVISFAFFTFLLVLGFRAVQALGTDNIDAMRAAEPQAPPHPPTGY